MNNRIVLVFPSEEYLEQIQEFKDEFFDKGKLFINGSHSLSKAEDIKEWIKNSNDRRKGIDLPEGRVPSSLYLAVRKEDNKIIGIVDIRHSFNDFVLKYGGQIRYSIRPTETNKGYAGRIFKLALLKAKDLKLDKVLITCIKSNIGLEQIILRNGGVFENEIVKSSNKTIFKRYWIKVSDFQITKSKKK